MLSFGIGVPDKQRLDSRLVGKVENPEGEEQPRQRQCLPRIRDSPSECLQHKERRHESSSDWWRDHEVESLKEITGDA